MYVHGYLRTFSHTLKYVRFTPESGHLGRGRYTSANDPKRTFAEVRLTLKYRTSERIYYFLNPWSYDYQPNLPRFHI